MTVRELEFAVMTAMDKSKGELMGSLQLFSETASMPAACLIKLSTLFTNIYLSFLVKVYLHSVYS